MPHTLSNSSPGALYWCTMLIRSLFISIGELVKISVYEKTVTELVGKRWRHWLVSNLLIQSFCNHFTTYDSAMRWQSVKHYYTMDGYWTWDVPVQDHCSYHCAKESTLWRQLSEIDCNLEALQNLLCVAWYLRWESWHVMLHFQTSHHLWWRKALLGEILSTFHNAPEVLGFKHIYFLK